MESRFDYKNLRSNVPISQKRKPYTKFWNEPVKVESLEYEALIKAAKRNFQTLNILPNEMI